MALIVSGRTISNKKKQAVPAFEWRTTQWIFRIQIFGAAAFRSPVIGKIARCAALEIDGVAEVSCGRQNKKLKDLLEASSIQSPVVVEMRDGTANITLNLMMSFGARIPAVAEKVQENVKNAVQNMTNVTVSRVNLVIAGLAETTAAEK